MNPDIYNRLVAGLLNNYKQVCDAWEQFPEEQRLSLKGPTDVIRVLMNRCRGQANRLLQGDPRQPGKPA